MTYQPGSHIFAVALSQTEDDDWSIYTVGHVVSDTGTTSTVFALDGNAGAGSLYKYFSNTAFQALLRDNPNYGQRIIYLVLRGLELQSRFPECAWPKRIVFDEADRDTPTHDKIRGIVLPEFDCATSLADLMVDDSARHGFGVTEALNVAYALSDLFDRLHSDPWHFVMGDVSPNNILLSFDFKSIRLIDTDGMSFTPDDGATVYDVPGLTSGYRSPLSFEQPEGAPLPAEHDDYVLAIHIFQLLMTACGCAGVHPMTPLMGSEDDNIQAGHFPYHDDHRADDVHPIPGKIYAQWDEELREAFDTTFTARRVLSAAEWRDLVDHLRRGL